MRIILTCIALLLLIFSAAGQTMTKASGQEQPRQNYSPQRSVEKDGSDTSMHRLDSGELQTTDAIYSGLIEISGVGTTTQVPFWMRSNRYGSVPLSGASLSILASAGRNVRTAKVYDWGGGVEVRGNVGRRADVILVEAYAKVKAGPFQLKAGRSKDVTGFVGDTLLSSGSLAQSGNALGIPKVELSVPRFSYLLGGKLFAFKGNFAYGWMGRGAVNYRYHNYGGPIYFHQKSLYGRFGKADWRVKLYGGFNHSAMWGWDKLAYGTRYDLNDWEAFQYVVTGKVYKGSKLGNQLGTIDLGFSYETKATTFTVYRQFIYDVGALYHLANLRDGLNGVSLLNKKEDKGTIQWKKLLVEFLYTKNQAGELWSPRTPSGDEDYYNNWGSGWSYRATGLGTPFITPYHTTRANLPHQPSNYFNNNRVVLWHLGLQGKIKKWDFLTKLSYSTNFGTYGTSLPGHSLGGRFFPPRYGLFGKQKQFAGYLEMKRELRNRIYLGFMAAHDEGGLLYPSTGASLSVSKAF